MAEKHFMGTEDLEQFSQLPSHSTDSVISNYENYINQSIVTKTLEATKKGIPPTFTVEETAYLTKRANDADKSPEISVITPAPVITLKKGKTELNIGRAAELVRKMEEQFSSKSTHTTSSCDKPIQQDSSEQFVGVSSPIVTERRIITDALPLIDQKPIQNKNAYEIRESILEKSIDIVNNTLKSEDYNTEKFVDKVLDVASKLYQFVENKNRKSY